MRNTRRWSNSRCPRNSRGPAGQGPPGAKPAPRSRALQDLPLRPGGRRQPAASTPFEIDLAECGPDGPGRADQDQERGRQRADLPPLLPRGHLRLLRDEHRRPQHAGLHPGDRRHRRATVTIYPLPHMAVIKDLVVDFTPFWAQYEWIQPWLQTEGPPPEKERLQSPGGPRPAGRPLRVHPLRLLHDRLPVLLVERRPVPGPGGPAPGLSLAGRSAATRPPASGSTRSRTPTSSTAATPS